MPVLPVGAVSASLVVVLMALAMIVAVVGHLIKIRGVVVAGLALLFVATFAMVVGGFGAWRDSPGPAPDPLRGDDRRLPPNESIGDARRQQQQRRDGQR
ncbi:hypothetical protein [Patulibacter medicamentivorans]|uniref:hypothetical protein n=1 Tax=Patulibacter medicamentivorans TaxID=1097667 RepID=UPI0011109B5D|nr:hypothetical protein [Patulibacter medicamentivorans]